MACYARAQLRVEFKKSCAMYCERVSEMVKIRHDSPFDRKGFHEAFGNVRSAFDEVSERKSTLNRHRMDHGC